MNGATVLAPKLYLAPGNVALTGGTIAAKDVSLAGASVNNSGTISGSNSLSILARNGDITNTGTLAGGSVSLVAQNGSIINSATLNDYLVNGGNQGQLGSVGTISASGAASLSASNDITFNGGRLSSGGDLSMLAGNSLTLEATKTQSEASASHHVAGISLSSQGAQGTLGYGMRDDKSSSSSTVWTPSVLASLGGNVALNAGKAITIDGSALSAANDLTLSGSSISLLAKENSLTQSMAHKEKSIGASIGLSPTSIMGQVVNTGLAASQTSGKGSGTLAALNAMQGAAIIATSIINGGEAVAGNIVGVRQSVGSSSLHQSSTETQTHAVGSTLNAGNTLSVVARGDNTADAQNGSLSATASSLSGKNVVLAASKDITLQAGWDTTHSESDMKSKSVSVGLDVGVGTGFVTASLSASFGKQTQHVVSDSATAVNTTVTGAQSVTIASPGSVTLNGATVTAPRIDLSAGSLNITSPQNTSDYRSAASQSGGQLCVGYKTGIGGSGLNQNVTDHFATTGPTLSGLYAGENGIGVDVSGQTSLTAGVIDSQAEAAENHFDTGSLVANSVTNVSQWKATQTGMSMSLGTDMLGSTMGILGAVGTNLASGASGMMGGGRAHHETSESQSAISGNITVSAGSITGHYTTDVSKANAALDNAFDAKKLSNQLHAQRLGSQLAGEIGGLVADQLEKAGVAGFGEEGIANSYGRITLETAANTAVAAVSGSNIGAAAAGTAAGGLATSATLDSVAWWALDQTNGDVATALPLTAAIENIIASGAGALGGIVGGNTSGNTGINALNGAGEAAAVEQYNMASLKLLKLFVK
ncbi:hemagglutinin repeat-containing protein [Asaia bogorensis]|uniref:hemagglutinin repeat-containing protein n=1 Tax=Asaia bogorensis TaxID=91915 RepID=UPI0011BEF9B0|nr:hemagglutinin repeat-containing protein [Asaia bogorensis]